MTEFTNNSTRNTPARAVEEHPPYSPEPARPVWCTLFAISIPLRDVTLEDTQTGLLIAGGAQLPQVQDVYNEVLDALEKKFGKGVRNLCSMQENAPNTGLPVGVADSLTGAWIPVKELARRLARARGPRRAPGAQPDETRITDTDDGKRLNRRSLGPLEDEFGKLLGD